MKRLPQIIVNFGIHQKNILRQNLLKLNWINTFKRKKMINNFEIGGNEVRLDGSDAIADIPCNRTLIVEKLTNDEAINPEVVSGLNSVEQVFSHYKPHVEINFEDGEGQSLNEVFNFHNVGDFNIKSLTKQSSFLGKINTEKEFYDNLIKQLRSNKVLQRALENPESKQAFMTALQEILLELETNENA